MPNDLSGIADETVDIGVGIPPLWAYSMTPVSGSVTITGCYFDKYGIQIGTAVSYTLSAANTLFGLAGGVFPSANGRIAVGFVGTTSGPVYIGAGGTTASVNANGTATTPVVITAATNANPIVITATAHGLANNQVVIIAGALGNTAANGTFVATVSDANTFSIPVAGNGAYTSGGKIVGTIAASEIPAAGYPIIAESNAFSLGRTSLPSDSVSGGGGGGGAGSVVQIADGVNVALKATVAGGALSINTAQVNGVATSTGAGAVGTGSQRVTVGHDTTTIAGSSPGTAGTASANVVTVQGIASMTKLLVTPDALPANQSVNVAQVAGATTATAASGVQKVGIVGNTGGAVDAAGQNVASPANELLVGGQFNTTPTTITNGNMSPLQLDPNGNLKETLATLIAGEDLTNNVQANIQKAIVASTYSPSSYNSANSGALVVKDNIKNAAGNLLAICAVNLNAATRYLWITNAAASPANALASSDPTVTAGFMIAMPTLTTLILPNTFFQQPGKNFGTGISYGFSTSATSYTAGTATDHTMNATYV